MAAKADQVCKKVLCLIDDIRRKPGHKRGLKKTKLT